MNGLLVRMLSTGRSGTRFLAQAFADQGYNSYHEDLYTGEPYSAITLYLHMLGDMWKQDKEKYYAFETDFARPYVRTVAEAMNARPASDRSSLLKKLTSSRKREKPGYVIHTAHYLTTATPWIERELEKEEIESRNLIVFRNPLKTIHALYLVEGGKGEGRKRPYFMRPPSFSVDETFLGAANVWANVYRIAIDQSRHCGAEKFHLLELESFSTNIEYAKKIFEFIGLEVDLKRFKEFSDRELQKPLRSAKSDSVRNSHLFHNPDFIFSDGQIGKIHGHIADVLEDYGIDWERCVQDYKQFHASEKANIGFAKQGS